MSRSIDAKLIENASAATAQAATFTLQGGKYGVAAIATWGGGSVKLQRLGPNGSTYLSVAAATDFTADGYATVDIPRGQYRFTCATASAIYAAVERIPGD